MSNELLDYFVPRFALFKAQVLRLASSSAGRVSHALNTLKLNGLTIEGIIAIIRGEVGDHELDRTAHGETLSSLGGMAKADFDVQVPRYYPNAGIPITRFPAVPAVIGADGRLYVDSFVMTYMARKIAVVATSFDITTLERQYLRVRISGPTPDYVATVELTTASAEDIRTLTFGILMIVDGAFAIVTEPSIRIGASPISASPRGGGIPHSAGTQAAPGQIPPSWYS